MTALIDLHSPAMDDAEPTQAADVPDDETQSIHAWSQTTDADTEPAIAPTRRSWRLPVALAAVAGAAAIGVGTVIPWPHHPASTHPTPAPTAAPTPAVPPPPPPPPLPVDPDQRFLALLNHWGVQVVAPSMAINAAHSVCKAVTENVSQAEITQRMVNQTPGADLKTAGIFLDAAQEVYCPPGT